MPNVQIGDKVVAFPDTMSMDEISEAIRNLSFSSMEEGGIAEYINAPLIALGGGLLGEVAGGISGLARTGYGLATGEGFEGAMRSGAETVEDVSGAIQKYAAPSTQRGTRAMEAVSSALSPVAEAFESVSRGAGDIAFGATGSPGAAAAAYTLPTAIAELLPIGILKRVRPREQLITPDGNPTPALRTALEDMGFTWEGLTPEAKSAIPPVAGQTAVTGAPSVTPRLLEQARVEQARTGGSEKALAAYELSNNKLIGDKPAQEAIKQWGDEGLIQLVKTATPATKNKMLEMLRLRQRITGDARVQQTQRPTDVAGKAAVMRISHLRNVAKKANEGLNQIARTQLAGKPMNPAPVLQELRAALEELNVGFKPGKGGIPEPVFVGSDISANRSAQSVIKTAFRLLSEGGAPDALRFHRLKRQLDELIDFKKATPGGLTGSGKNVLKKLRRALNNELRGVNTKYGDMNDVLSDVLSVFDELDSVSGKRTNIFDTDSYSALGQEFRKLATNYGVRSDMIDAIRLLEKTTAKYGGKFNDSIMDLSTFATALDSRFGPVAKGSMAGIMDEQAKIAAAAGAMMRGAAGGKGQAALNLMMDRYRKMKGIKDEAAYKAMEELLIRGGK